MQAEPRWVTVSCNWRRTRKTLRRALRTSFWRVVAFLGVNGDQYRDNILKARPGRAGS